MGVIVEYLDAKLATYAVKWIRSHLATLLSGYADISVTYSELKKND